MKKVSIFFKDSKPSTQVAGLCFLVLLGFLFATGIQLIFPTADYSSPAGVRMALLSQACATLLIFGFPAIAFAMVFHPGTQLFQLDFAPRKWVLSLVAVVIWMLLTPASDWLTTWNYGWNFGSMDSQFRQYSTLANATTEHLLSLATPVDLALQLLIVALIPAICEELFFRGAMQQTFLRCFGNRHAAILITALLFALAHGDLYGLMPRFLMGVMLGYLFSFGGSMVVNTITHFINNATIVVLYYCYHLGLISFPPTAPLAISWITTLLCTIASIALFVVYFAKNEEKLKQK